MNRRDPSGALVALVHLALGALYFGPAFLTAGIVLPAELLHPIYPWGAYFRLHANHNRELTDVILQFHPWFLEWSGRLLSGELPLWCPEIGLGLPASARAISAPFFPLTGLALLGSRAGWNLLLLLRLVLAGTTSFFWLREVGRSREASLLGSIAFAYSLPFVTWLPWPHANVQALLPLLLLAAHRLALRGGPRPVALFASTLALMHLGGHPESVFLGTSAAVLVFLFAARSSIHRKVTGLVAAGILGTLAASVQLIPFLEYLGRSRVVHDAAREAVSLPRSRLLTWVVPDFFGREMNGSLWVSGHGFLDFGAFAGVSVLSLGLAGLVLARRRIPHGLVVAGALSVGLAYGLPVIRGLSKLPLLDVTMTHRSLPIAAAAVATLGAFGWDRLRALARRRRARLPLATLLFPGAVAAVAVLAVVVAWAAVPGARPHLGETAVHGALVAALLAPLPWLCLAVHGRLRILGAAVVVTADLWAASFGWLGSVPRELVWMKTGVTDFLSTRREEGRVLPLGWTMPPNTNLPYGVRSVLGYDAVDLDDQAAFLRELGGYVGHGLYSTVFPERLSNVRVAELSSLRFYLEDPLQPRKDTPEFSTRTGFALRVVYDAPDGRIYELPSARPTAWFTGLVVPDPGFRRFAALLKRKDAAVVERAFLDMAAAPPGGGAAGTARVTSRRANRLEVEGDATGPGVLVVSEGWYPGWTAKVNGHEALLLRANGVLRAVAVPGGRSHVVLTYRPMSYVIGAALSVLGLVVIVLLVRGRSRPLGK
jgi:Bacterial membrane protein YfhO